MDNAVEKVLEVMENSELPMSAGQIAEASGLERKEVDKAMKILKKEEKIVSPKRCYWEPKK
jgi:predicted Zn-ribbon and HTH transcriptional regulator